MKPTPPAILQDCDLQPAMTPKYPYHTIRFSHMILNNFWLNRLKEKFRAARRKPTLAAAHYEGASIRVNAFPALWPSTS